MALWALHAAASRRLTLARRANLLPLNLQPCHAAAHRRPEVDAHLVLKIGPGLRPTRTLLAAGEHPAENVLKAPAKPSALLLLRVTSPRLKVRKIKPIKVERNLLRTATLRTITSAAATGEPTTSSRSFRRSRGLTWSTR